MRKNVIIVCAAMSYIIGNAGAMNNKTNNDKYMQNRQESQNEIAKIVMIIGNTSKTSAEKSDGLFYSVKLAFPHVELRFTGSDEAYKKAFGVLLGLLTNKSVEKVESKETILLGLLVEYGDPGSYIVLQDPENYYTLLSSLYPHTKHEKTDDKVRITVIRKLD
jgi:hypothetical protein